jgi:CheY-like chemotaxis protein
MKIKDTIHIMLVEDNEGDVMLTKEALEETNLNLTLSVLNDGKEAVDFLEKTGKYVDRQLPDLLLLDINLPKKNGFEVLKFIKGNEHLKHIPVVMLSTSSSQRDIDLTYNNYANCFITKPSEVNEFIDTISALVNFWFSVCKMPNKSHNV